MVWAQAYWFRVTPREKGKLAKLNEGWGGKNLELCDICIF